MILTVCSTKGGVGKTTLTANLGGLLASLGNRVLLVDADIQPALSTYYALTTKAPQGLKNLLMNAEASNSISVTDFGCDLIYSNDSVGELSNWMINCRDCWRFLSYRLQKIKASYDFILIDTQGAAGPLQDAAIFAADKLISPIPTETLSAREFSRGMVGMLTRLRTAFYYSGLTIPPLIGMLYRVDRTRDAALVTADLRGHVIETLQAAQANADGLPNLAISILDAHISASVCWREAATLGVPIHTLTKYPLAKLQLLAILAELQVVPMAQVENIRS